MENACLSFFQNRVSLFCVILISVGVDTSVKVQWFISQFWSILVLISFQIRVFTHSEILISIGADISAGLSMQLPLFWSILILIPISCDLYSSFKFNIFCFALLNKTPVSLLCHFSEIFTGKLLISSLSPTISLKIIIGAIARWRPYWCYC